jgi:hypothetical protein
MKNKKSIIFIALLAISFVVELQAQEFEGMISYDNSYLSKTSEMSSEQLNNLMGTEQAYVIKGNKYKSAFNGVFMSLHLYRGDENRSYTITGQSDTIYWEDYGVSYDEAINYEIHKHQDTILGVSCDLIIVQTENSLMHFYYNSMYGVNPDLFSQHHYANWYYTISKTKALPLKTVVENIDFIMTSVAIEVKPMILEDGIFEILDKDKNKLIKATW